jgi:hypothetical protein
MQAKPVTSASSSANPSLSLLRRSWDAFLLRPAKRRLNSYSARQARAIRELCAAAAPLAEAAQRLFDADEVGAGIELAKEAASLYARAAAVSQSEPEQEQKPDAAAAWETFDRLLEASAFGTPPAGFRAARELFVAPDTRSWAELPLEEAQARADSILPALRWLRELVEPRTLSQVSYLKWRRFAALVLAAALAAYAILSPRNLALHRPVLFSSKHSASTAADGELVDGVLSSTYGAHTNLEQMPWVMVDLGRPRKIGLVKIYNRGDSAFDEGLPLILEFSEDAVNFEEIDSRTTTFSISAPWTIAPRGKVARYLRVRGKQGGFVALNELEAYE